MCEACDQKRLHTQKDWESPEHRYARHGYVSKRDGGGGWTHPDLEKEAVEKKALELIGEKRTLETLA